MATQPDPASRRSRRLLLVVPVVVIAVVVAGAIWFLRDDAPERVSLDTATAALERTTTTGAAAPASSAPAGTAAGGATTTTGAVAPAGSSPAVGSWTVDTSVGTFDFEKSTGSFVGFRVKEELSSIGSTTAVGRTPAVSGNLVIVAGANGATTVTAVNITADMTKLVTNDSRRDSKARGALGTGQFPNATFVLRKPITLDGAVAEGKPVSITAEGDLTIKGVTRPVRFPLEARLLGPAIVVVGSLDIVFADYGVSVPSAPIVLSVEDRGPIELQLFFRRA